MNAPDAQTNYTIDDAAGPSENAIILYYPTQLPEVWASAQGSSTSAAYNGTYQIGTGNATTPALMDIIFNGTTVSSILVRIPTSDT
jgi:hypothetical protein